MKIIPYIFENAVILSSRTEANQVLDRLIKYVAIYDFVTVADLYELVGIPSKTHMDNTHGWTDLSKATITKDPQGYLMDFPEPERLVSTVK